MTHVLVSGAGIAGTALAYWLRRRGLVPTVVERSPAIRAGGQAVDVRGVALEVIARMGVLPAVRAARTTMRGMSVLDQDGRELMRSTERTYTAGRLDSDDVELLREDLTGILHETTRGEVEHLFGDSIVALEDDADGVRVRFERGGARRFDLVVGADGLHSSVRRLAFGDERGSIVPLGTHLAIFSAPNSLGIEDWQTWVRGPESGAAVYPVRGNRELRIMFGFASPPSLGLEHGDVVRQKQLVAERVAGLRWEVPRMVEAMWSATDFWFDVMAQVRMERWSRGRAVLVGDAGYCGSPMSGQGTSLALVGAYVLADELARERDHAKALARYEERMRPYVEVNQALALQAQEGPPPEEAIDRAKNAIALDG